MTSTRLSGHTIEFERVQPVGPGLPPGTELPPQRGLLRRPWFWVTLVAVVVLAAVGYAVTARDGSAPAEHRIALEITGTAPTASVTYSTAGRDQAQSEDAAALPFDREVTVRAVAATASISATVPAGSTGTLSCTITIDGRVVASNTSSGASDTVACTGYAEGDPGDVPAGTP